MRNLTATLCLTLTLLLGSSGVSWSADFQKGYTAYKSGDFATALREWEPLANQGDAVAQSFLGWMYRKGKGVPQDYKTAVKWYRLAAEQRLAVAQYHLGNRYYNGQGVPKNHKTAVKWYRLAADQGYARAQYNLGNRYAKGQGVPQDYKTALKWYRLAAEQGHARAQKQVEKLQEKIAEQHKLRELSDDPEELAHKFVESREWVVGVNNADQNNEFVVSIEKGNTLLEAFCNVVSDIVGVLSIQKNSNKLMVTNRSELTFRSKFKVKTKQKLERRENIDGLVSEMSQSSFSIKSPKGRLFCQNLYQSKKSQLHLEVKSQLVLEFMGNDLDFSDVFKEFQSSGLMKIFIDHKPKQAPHFSIVFASYSRDWRY